MCPLTAADSVKATIGIKKWVYPAFSTTCGLRCVHRPWFAHSFFNVASWQTIHSFAKNDNIAKGSLVPLTSFSTSFFFEQLPRSIYTSKCHEWNLGFKLCTVWHMEPPASLSEDPNLFHHTKGDRPHSILTSSFLNLSYSFSSFLRSKLEVIRNGVVHPYPSF